MRALVIAALLLAPALARAQADAGPDAGADAADEVEAQNDASGYTPPAGAVDPLSVSGYVDVGFARASGDGSAFAPNDTRVPADYGTDPFAPAVNSRGEVASTDAHGRFTNHFLPYSVGIGSRPSFLLNTVDADVRYAPATQPYLLFARFQALPRFYSTGESTRVLVEQAFARVTPFEAEFALTVGKFDPVFGIEYLDNEANLRTGVTPSLIARYTTGQQLGAKAFYRKQLAPLWSALSINLAATNGSPEIEPLQTNSVSLTGTPVLSVRLGYELNLPQVEVKLGASGMHGPRNDQSEPDVMQTSWDFDARLITSGLTLAGEVVDLDQQEGTRADKLTGTGEGVFPTGFHVRGFYGFLAYAPPFSAGPLHKLTVYGRYGRRHAEFYGFEPVLEQRFTAGLRLDLWDALALKGEYLWNRELAGAPNVDDDVLTTSLVFTW